MALTLIHLKISSSLYFFFPRLAGHHDELLGQTLAIQGIVTLFAALVFFILGRHARLLPPQIPAGALVPITLYLSLESPAYLLDHVFILERRTGILTFLLPGREGLRLTLVLGAALLWDGVVGIAYALVVFAAVRVVALLWYLRRRYSLKFRIVDRGLLVEQLKYTAPLAVSSVVATVGKYFEKGVISALMSASEFAVYSVGSLGVVGAVTLLYSALGDAAMQRFGELATNQQPHEIRRLWHRMVLTDAVVTIPLVSFCIAFAPEIIAFLFTAAYAESANIWRVNLLILPVQMVGYGYVPRALGRTKAILTGNALRASVVVVLSLVLVSRVGLLGGAISFVIGFWANAVAQLWATKAGLQLPFGQLLPWPELLEIVLLGGPLVLLVKWAASQQASTSAALLLGGFAYFTIQLVLLKGRGHLDEVFHVAATVGAKWRFTAPSRDGACS